MKFIEVKSRLRLGNTQAADSEFEELTASKTCHLIATDMMRHTGLLNSILD